MTVKKILHTRTMQYLMSIQVQIKMLIGKTFVLTVQVKDTTGNIGKGE